MSAPAKEKEGWYPGKYMRRSSTKSSKPASDASLDVSSSGSSHGLSSQDPSSEVTSSSNQEGLRHRSHNNNSELSTKDSTQNQGPDDGKWYPGITNT
jgi:hypothetical protein